MHSTRMEHQNMVKVRFAALEPHREAYFWRLVFVSGREGRRISFAEDADIACRVRPASVSNLPSANRAFVQNSENPKLISIDTAVVLGECANH
jgi:hypothetical protein